METYVVIVVILLGLTVILQLISLIKITQIQNNQRHKENKNNSVNDGKNRPQNNQNPNKKNRDNNVGQNNRSAQQSNQKVQQQGGEKKFERIVSNAQPLRETNTQLGNRSKENKNFNSQSNKPKVYSERIAVQKQERPSNAPIKQTETIKPETIEQEKQKAVFAESVTENIKANTNSEVKSEVAIDAKAQQSSGSVQYGRR
jgi:hypothetical protein